MSYRIALLWTCRKSFSLHHTHPNPYTNKSVDYVLSSTKKNLNKWVTVKANVKEHFKKFHNLDVNQLNGVAVMADTDNSKLSSVSYFQNIFFSSE